MRSARRFELGRGGREAGGVDGDARMRQPRQAMQFVGVVPDDVELRADGDDHGMGRPAAPAMLERREIGRGNAERLGHLLQADAALGAELAQAHAERRHRRRRNST